MTTSDKRQFKRLESSLKVRFTLTAASDTSAQPGRVVNISKSGLLLHQKNDLTPGALIDIAMVITKTTVRYTGQCIYCSAIEPGTYEAGIQIKTIDPQAQDIFFAYIAELEKKDHIFQSLRPHIGGITDVIKRITAEHKIINRYVIVIRKLLDTDMPDFEQLSTLLTLMKKDLIPHFRIEDKLVFKVASRYLGSQTASVMANLSEEHITILDDLDTLTQTIQAEILANKTVSIASRNSITAFLEKIIQHARFELAELFPIIEDNLEAKEMIMKKILERT